MKLLRTAWLRVRGYRLNGNDLSVALLGSPSLSPFVVLEVEGEDLRVLMVSDRAREVCPLVAGDFLGEKMPMNRAPLRHGGKSLIEIYSDVALNLAPWQGEIVYDADEVSGVFFAKATPLGKDRVFVGWQDLSESRNWEFDKTKIIAVQSALLRREIVFYLQPIYRLADNVLSGFEALARWPQPGGGCRSPGDFLPTITQAGLDEEFFYYSLDYAIEILLPLLPKELTVSLNLDPPVISSLRFPDAYIDRCTKEGVCESLSLEVTESATFSIDMIGKLQAVRNASCRVGMDDFGTKNASYRALQTAPIDYLKADRSLVTGVAGNDRQAAALLSTLSFTKAMGFDMVAEGIESKADLDWLTEHGCQYAQGFYLGRPMPLEQVLDLIATEKMDIPSEA